MGEWKSKLAGIYMLEFPNGMVYIGKSRHLKKRIGQHMHGKASNRLLEDAWSMFGRDSVKTVYLETIPINEDTNWEEVDAILNEKEKEYIAKYRSNDRLFGYNQYDGGAHGVGYVCSEEHKEKLRISHLGKKLPPVSEEKRRKLSQALKGRRPSPQCEEARLKAVIGKKQTKEHRQKVFLNDPRHRRIASYDLEGNLLKVYFCLRDAANDANVPYQGIQRVLKGTRKKCGGLIWKYYNEE